jgi:hypothetical protein
MRDAGCGMRDAGWGTLKGGSKTARREGRVEDSASKTARRASSPGAVTAPALDWFARTLHPAPCPYRAWLLLDVLFMDKIHLARS